MVRYFSGMAFAVGAYFLIYAVGADSDPLRGLAACAFFALSKYLLD